jgi:predicted TIM-barrel enzyme
MDVVTTSGPGTGQAARPEKVRAMKEAIGSHPLALASGVTPENVTDYLAWVDCFLVATGISYTFEELDPGRVADLVEVVRTWAP